MVVDIRDHGAAVDGTTDDTEAINQAIAAAAPDGTVALPEGDILIGKYNRIPIRLTEDEGGLTFEGAGPTKTRLLMAGGQTDTHFGIYVKPSSGAAVSGLRFKNFTLDGQGLKQNYSIGLGIEVKDTGGPDQPVEIRNCVVRDWAVNGIKLRAPGGRIYDSTISLNGRKREADTGQDGHGIDSSLDTDTSDEVVIDGCLIQGNTGAGADNGGGKMTIRNSVIDDCGYAVKQNDDTVRQVIENTRISNIRTEPGIYNIPPDQVGGTLVLNTVVIEDVQWSGIDLPAAGKVVGDRLVIRRTNLGNNQAAGFMIRDEGRELNLGEVSVTDTVGGSGVYFQNCSGSIDRLVHSGNDGGLGPTSGVSISSVETGNALDVTVPTIDQVGATASSTTDSSGSTDSTDSTANYGGYARPEMGMVNWHLPLNENFEKIEADVLELAQRLDKLE
jgi:hypothetical protein